MEEEKLLLCDCKSYQNNKGELFYYLIIYSSYEYLEKVFISKDDFDFVVKNKNNININNFLHRVFNRTKQAFVLRFQRGK